MSNKKKKIYSIFGTRPEAIKMAVLCQKLNEIGIIDHKIVLTGQHKEMLYQVMDFFGLKASYDLQLMKPGQDLTDITSNVLLKLRDLFLLDRPDLVLVHGDTTTSFAATLASFYQNIPVGHVEAGLRTHNLASPFPEEANRTLTSRLASFHFAPTKINYDNLMAEGLVKNILITGNTVIDSLLYADKKVNSFSNKIKNPQIIEIFKSDSKIILVTGHRRENFGDGFLNICKALLKTAKLFPDVEIVYPVHLNPNVQEPVNNFLKGVSNIHLLEPMDYHDFIYAMKRSFLILTDSGGIQEEAPSLGKPVLVMRDTTERPEAVKAGTVKLVGANEGSIVNGIAEIINNVEVYESMCKSHNPYGDGEATEKIVEFLMKIKWN
jgi:UDP-N-acetylglucosamine 2-epimerase (non-hydrolysing)